MRNNGIDCITVSINDNDSDLRIRELYQSYIHTFDIILSAFKRQSTAMLSITVL